MEIRRIAEDDATAIEDWFQLRLAWTREMPGDPGPCRTFHGAALTMPWPDEQERAYLGIVDGQPVGFYAVTLHLLDNVDVLGVELAVHPDHRGKGYGSALLESLDALAGELGCTRLLAEMPMDGPGAPWARSRGARPVSEMMHRRLDLSAVDTAVHDELLADARAHAAGYTLLQWTSPIPDEHLAGCAVLEGKMSTDMPLDDLAWEPEVYDAERMRRRSEMIEARGTATVHLCCPPRRDRRDRRHDHTDPAGHSSRTCRPVGDDRARGASRSPARHAAQDREPALRAARATPAALHRHGELRLQRTDAAGEPRPRLRTRAPVGGVGTDPLPACVAGSGPSVTGPKGRDTCNQRSAACVTCRGSRGLCWRGSVRRGRGGR